MAFKSLAFSTADIQDQVRRAARARRVALSLTQAELSARSGVALSTLKRFEQTGEIGFSALLDIADVLDALDGFGTLFPLPQPKSLDDLDRGDLVTGPSRVRKRKRS